MSGLAGLPILAIFTKMAGMCQRQRLEYKPERKGRDAT